jgi:hypothetical protein
MPLPDNSSRLCQIECKMSRVSVFWVSTGSQACTIKHGHVEIIEIAGGDPAHTHIYNGPQLYGPDADLAPVTLNFVDMNGDHKPDMIVTFQESRIIFINDHDTFRPMLPTERSQVEQALQHSGVIPV